MPWGLPRWTTGAGRRERDRLRVRMGGSSEGAEGQLNSSMEAHWSKQKRRNSFSLSNFARYQPPPRAERSQSPRRTKPPPPRRPPNETKPPPPRRPPRGTKPPPPRRANPSPRAERTQA